MVDVDHLLELAKDLADPPGAGAPRQVVLRRAVSTAYYALFHALCGHAAGTFVAQNVPKARTLFYRSLEHGKCKERCKKLGQNPLQTKEKAFFARGAFGAPLRTVANSFVELQEWRHNCDYDPDYKIAKVEALQAVDEARNAIAELKAANAVERSQFLAYLLLGLRN